MVELQSSLESLRGENPEYRPAFFDCSKASDRKQLESLVSGGQIFHAVDDYREQLFELFQIENPSRIFEPEFQKDFETHRVSLEKKLPLWQQGTWVLYPWKATVTHVLPEEDFFKVRTARNKNLITAEEQEKFYRGVIGIAGLSVGNSVILAIVLQGGGKRIKLADMDRLALSNTNRIRAGVDQLGVQKVVVTARQIFEVNPYAEVELFVDGLSKENIGSFFEGLDIVIDEIDNLAVKCLIREQAKKLRLPVVMAADNGDNGVVDIERYDLSPDIPFFHGRMGKVSYDMLKNLDKLGIGKYITKLVGVENVTERMQASLLTIGKTNVSWPQLGGAALLNGSAVAYCVRKILNGEPLEADRALISLDEKLDPDHMSPETIQRRKEAAKSFAERFGIK